MTGALGGTFRVGDWRVDPALDEISRDGTSVKLEPRAMRVLVCLAERAGEVVSVDELLDAVWKDVVVTPDSVYQTIAVLRRAFSDGTAESPYFVNVLRRGYRLMAPVTQLADTTNDAVAGASVSDPDQAHASLTADTTRSRVQWRWVVFGLGVALIVGFVIAGRSRHSLPATHSANGASVSTAGTDVGSVAVLPFVDISEKRDQAYFADGLTAELIDRLAKIPGLRVPAATSSFYFKGKSATVGQMAKALGVMHLLEGSVRKSGNTLRITTQLVRADTGYEVWSETFDRPLTDLFKIQDEIAGAVVQALKLSILEHFRPEHAPTANIEAYTLYLRALSRLVKNGVADYDAGAKDLRAALELDPQFASAWALLATSTVYAFEVTGQDPTPAACATAHAAAEKALRLNSALAVAHSAKGVVIQYCDANLPAAEVEFRTALELEPGSASTLRGYSWLEWAAGQFDQALQLARRAVALDPLNEWGYTALGDALWGLNRYGEAEVAYRKAVQIDPIATSLHGRIANLLLTEHRPIEAVVEAEAEPGDEMREETLPFALDGAGRSSDADRAISVYQLKYGDKFPGEIAAFYACRHDADHAIRWLQTFAARNSGGYDSFAYRKNCFRNLESDPRYQALRQQLKLP